MALKPVRKDIRQLTSRVEHLERELAATSQRARDAEQLAQQFHLTAVLNTRQRARLAEALTLLDEGAVARHVRAAIEAAPMRDTPFEHIIVERLLPDAVYEALIEAIPPPAFFSSRDPIKQDLTLPTEIGPTLTATVWGFFDDVVARRVIRPAVIERFRRPLEHHFDSLFGPDRREQAIALPQSVSGGRLMLRRPGYHLKPHRDPKRSMLTCLLYLARPDDNDVYGTQIFAVDDDDDADYKQTYFPEEAGRRCRLEGVVPFRPNSMLVFLNARGAHGADIPADAPASLERYSYQFYIAPENAALAALIKSLPPDLRRKWQNKGYRTETHAGM
jgi:hypothetical protein